MQYTNLYDSAQHEFQNWSQLEGALVFMIVPSFILWYWRRSGGKLPPILSFILGGMIFLGVAMLPQFIFSYRHYLAIRSATSQSSVQIIEGVVTNLHQPRRDSSGVNGTRLEPAEFSVNGILFRCWDKNNQRGHDFFQQSDVLHEGLHARIYYVNLDGHENTITRLEVLP